MRRRSPHFKWLLVPFNLLVDIARLLFFSCFDFFALGRRKSEPVDSNAIMVIRLDAIGDYLLFRPFLEQVRTSQMFGGRPLVLCGNIAWRELAERFDAGVVDRFIWLDRGKFGSSLKYRYHKIRELTAVSYQAVISPAFTRELLYCDRIVKLLEARTKFGSVGDPGTMGGWRKWLGDRAFSQLIPATPEVIFELDRNREFWQNLLAVEVRIPDRLIPIAKVPVGYQLPKRYGLLFVGASADYKKWPISYFFKVGDFLRRHYGMELVVAGAAEDGIAIRQANLNGDGRFVDLTGKTSLSELAELVRRAEILISNETMPPHLAGLAGHPPCVVISCSGCFGRFFPYPRRIADSYRIVYHPEIDRDHEEFKRISNTFGFYNTLDIASISPAMVIAKTRELLESSEDGSRP